jgi:hypothetical protein
VVHVGNFHILAGGGDKCKNMKISISRYKNCAWLHASKRIASENKKCGLLWNLQIKILHLGTGIFVLSVYLVSKFLLRYLKMAGFVDDQERFNKKNHRNQACQRKPYRRKSPARAEQIDVCKIKDYRTINGKA